MSTKKLYIETHGCQMNEYDSSLVAGILAREQWVVRGGRLERIDHAFFTLNSLVGLIFFAGHLMEWVVARLAP